MWVVMSQRKIPDYEAIFKFVSDNWQDLVPETIVCDFEKALHKAAINIFGCRIRGCFFHYSQVNYKIFFLMEQNKFSLYMYKTKQNTLKNKIDLKK